MIQKAWQTFQESFRALWENRVGQIPALDGLRALAITIVIASHSKNDFFHVVGEQAPAWFFTGAGYGWIGVDLFFVLSGFLIGKILFEEIRSTGSLEVGPFLLKRGLRIWPLYFFVCSLSLFEMAYQHRLPSLGALLPDFLFLTNFFDEHLAFGSWSLSVEEQFYLLTSVFLFWSIRRSRSWKSPTGALVGLLMAAPLIRYLTWSYYRGWGVGEFDLEWNILHSYIFTHYEGLALGLLFASLTVFRQSGEWLRARLSQVLGIAIVGVAGLLLIHRLTFLYTLVSLVFGAAVWHCLQSPQGRLARFFSWPGFTVISRLSYGMYLWYRFPLWRIADFVTKHAAAAPNVVQYFLIFAIAFVVAALAAAVTFVMVERPFLMLRSKIFSRTAEKIERVGDGHLDYT